MLVILLSILFLLFTLNSFSQETILLDIERLATEDPEQENFTVSFELTDTSSSLTWFTLSGSLCSGLLCKELSVIRAGDTLFSLFYNKSILDSTQVYDNKLISSEGRTYLLNNFHNDYSPSHCYFPPIDSFSNAHNTLVRRNVEIDSLERILRVPSKIQRTDSLVLSQMFCNGWDIKGKFYPYKRKMAAEYWEKFVINLKASKVAGFFIVFEVVYWNNGANFSYFPYRIYPILENWDSIPESFWGFEFSLFYIQTNFPEFYSKILDWDIFDPSEEIAVLGIGSLCEKENFMQKQSDMNFRAFSKLQIELVASLFIRDWFCNVRYTDPNSFFNQLKK